MRLKKTRPAQYAVMLHAYNIIVPNPTGGEDVGGVHTWRYVRAGSEAAAVAAAIKLLANDAAFRNHIRNPPGLQPHFEATQVIRLQREDLLEGDGTGLVFYIDPEEQAQH
jgi:hypothetical protein